MYFNKEYMLFAARKQLFANFINKIELLILAFQCKTKKVIIIKNYI